MKIENEDENKPPEKIRLTEGRLKDEHGNSKYAIQLTNESRKDSGQLIWIGMAPDQIQLAVEKTCRKPVIYYYGYDTNTTISTAVTLDSRLSFYELIPGLIMWSILTRHHGWRFQDCQELELNVPNA